MSATAAYEEILAGQRRRRIRGGAEVLVIMGIILAGGYYSGLFDYSRLAQGIPDLWDLMVEGMPPNFSNWKQWLRPLVDTLAMSIAGTALAVAFSVPLGFLAARNTSPHPVVYYVARAILNGLRAIPELIMGIIFVAAVGFGALPGVLALGLHSIGMVGKFFAESIELSDDKPVEAALAAGASKMQVVWHAILPQVLPQMADVSLYRWEYNFRASTVLGAVGAGGIGFELIGALRVLRYDEVTALILLILVMVSLVDSIGSRLREGFK